jgi:flavin-dependent dehydrogenase
MIRVLGAGISGLTAAINLVKNGEEVIVYEKLPDIGMRIKPNFQGLTNYDTGEDIIENLEKLNVKINYQTKLERIFIYSSDLRNKAEIFSSERPVAYTVIRGGIKSIEYHLGKQAKKLGIKIVTNYDKQINANIKATGASRVDATAYGGVFKGNFNKKEAIIIFDFRYAPGHYMYLLPHSKKIATIALGMKPLWNPKESFERALKKYEILTQHLQDLKPIYNFSSFLNFKVPKTAIENNSLLVGEAAGFQDHAFCFGIRYAIYSGYLAAKSIIENKNYDELWKNAFLDELKKTSKMRVFLDRFGNDSVDKLIKIIGRKSIEEFHKIWNSKQKIYSIFLRSILPM